MLGMGIFGVLLGISRTTVGRKLGTQKPREEIIRITAATVTGIYPPMIRGAGAVTYSLVVHAPNHLAVVTGKFDHGGNRIPYDNAQMSEREKVYRIGRSWHGLP